MDYKYDKIKYVKFNILNNDSKKMEAIFYDENMKIITKSKFGATGYKDYIIYNKELTKKEADKKRDNYIKRHKIGEYERWRSEIWTPAALSRWILWERRTLNESINNYSNLFNIKII